jgi:exodeoxyribonuclease-5
MFSLEPRNYTKKQPPHVSTSNLNTWEQKLLEGWSLLPTDGQVQAVRTFAHFLTEDHRDRVFLLTGYAGTGKTTWLRTLAALLPPLGFRTVLLAPTGRAAIVIAERTGRRAFTVHRIIYRAVPRANGGVTFSLRENPLERAVFFVDEASMLSDRPGDGLAGSSLLEDLLRFVQSGTQCRLVLLGDSAQLPPVGEADSQALDLRQLRQKHGLEVMEGRLTEVLRQAKTSTVLVNATRIRQALQSKKIRFPLQQNAPDFVRLEDSNAVLDALERAFLGRPDQSVFITKGNKRAVLYNRQIRARILGLEERLATGDRVMVVKNNYHWLEASHPAGFLANGDQLEIVRLVDHEEKYGLTFAQASLRWLDRPDDPPVEAKIVLDALDTDGPALTVEQSASRYQGVQEEYAHLPTVRQRRAAMDRDPYLNALQVKFAYAITCHKAQGGQWESVFVEQPYEPEGYDQVAYFRWYYTAITRASDRVYLVGFPPDWMEE